MTKVRRMRALIRGFRTQYEDRDSFYTFLAEDTVALIERYEPLSGRTVLDVGGGSGYFAEALRRTSADGVFVERSWSVMTEPGRQLGNGVIGDGCRLPIRDASFDVGFSSNVVEHVQDPYLFLNELVRVVRRGGVVFVAFTNWLSPFGGHETSPWHYMGGERAARRYQRKTGKAPMNRFGENLFPLSIANVLSWARHHPLAELVDTFPRYYPPWTKPLVHVPGLREVFTWNLVVVLRRHEGVELAQPSTEVGLASSRRNRSAAYPQTED